MVSNACLIGADENIFQESDKFLVAAQTDTMLYLAWPSFNLRGNTKLAYNVGVRMNHISSTFYSQSKQTSNT
jgi:hypothetical protein